MAEDGKVAVRNVRRDARHELEALASDGEVGEDDVVRAEKELDKHHPRPRGRHRRGRSSRRRTSCSRSDTSAAGVREEEPRAQGRRRRAELPDKEGVRIIGAEEAAEALERDDVAQRRGERRAEVRRPARGAQGRRAAARRSASRSPPTSRPSHRRPPARHRRRRRHAGDTSSALDRSAHRRGAPDLRRRGPRGRRVDRGPRSPRASPAGEARAPNGTTTSTTSPGSPTTRPASGPWPTTIALIRRTGSPWTKTTIAGTSRNPRGSAAPPPPSARTTGSTRAPARPRRVRSRRPRAGGRRSERLRPTVERRPRRAARRRCRRRLRRHRARSPSPPAPLFTANRPSAN